MPRPLASCLDSEKSSKPFYTAQAACPPKGAGAAADRAPASRVDGEPRPRTRGVPGPGLLPRREGLRRDGAHGPGPRLLQGAEPPGRGAGAGGDRARSAREVGGRVPQHPPEGCVLAFGSIALAPGPWKMAGYRFASRHFMSLRRTRMRWTRPCTVNPRAKRPRHEHL